MAKTYDLNDDSVVVVIGSGAGGGTLSNELAQKGVDVVCLEAGSRLEMSDIVHDPPLMNQRMGWHDKRYGPPTWLCKTVGGTTMRWSGMALRLQEHEFKPLTTYGKLNNTTLIDWPLTLQELAPYYGRAEDKMSVSGTHGIPASPETNTFKVLRAGGKRVGYKEIDTRNVAINPVDRDGRPACRQLGFCHSGCAISAKWSTLYTEIPKAETTGHFELRPKSMAVKINHNGDGKVAGVVYLDDKGALHEQKARAVSVAGNVVETTRLLLNSETSRFPDGLANFSGQLGKNYMRHLVAFVFAVMPGPVNGHRGTRQAGLIRDEQYHKPERGFAGGYLLQTAAGPPETIAQRLGWGRETAAWLDQYDHTVRMLIIGEDLPQEGNRIRLHPTEKDAHGLPVPVIEYAEHPNTTTMREHSVAAGKAVYDSLGATRLFGTEGVLSTCHNMGAARMCANPRDGVCNRWGRTHDISNLFISDGSVFSSSAAENPTLTIVALAIRQAEHIADQMRRGVL